MVPMLADFGGHSGRPRLREQHSKSGTGSSDQNGEKPEGRMCGWTGLHLGLKKERTCESCSPGTRTS